MADSKRRKCLSEESEPINKNAISNLLYSLKREQLINIIQEDLDSNHSLYQSIIQHAKENTYSRQVIIKNIPYDGDETELMSLLESYGYLLSCSIIFDTKTGASKGYAFAVFEDVACALKACTNPPTWKGRKLSITVSQTSPKISSEEDGIDRDNRKLYIQNISYRTTENHLLRFFSAYGNVSDCCICKNEDGSSKGFGFITFQTEDATRKCLQDHTKYILDNRELRISLAARDSTIGLSTISFSPGCISK